jgi:Asp-tRNA(Asn)/Glu-tRNA(Gln) amidotransferase A subunit family amidase
MLYETWSGDACSLVDAFRTGERSPVEELEATFDAIDASDLNAFSFVDREPALERARAADVGLPFGGVPVGIKELDTVAGWPQTEASLVFKDRTASYTSTMLTRLFEQGGANPVGQTTASEFGGLNVSTTKLNGTTHNPWRHGRTAGGSSGGSAAAVGGGLVPIASGGDGGGSIRIPAAFCGLLGMKGTFGRIPRGPRTMISPLTVVVGCVARSVRDAARWFDVCNGHDLRDPYSLPRIDGWERGLGTNLDAVRGMKVAIAPTLGSAIVRPEVEERVRTAGEALAADTGLQILDIPVKLPGLGTEWAVGNLATLLADLGDRWPDCKDDLTPEIAFGLEFAGHVMNLQTAAASELARIAANEAMAEVFDQVDFVIAATNPDVAYPAEVTLNTRVGDLRVGPENNGALTIPANIVGNPAVSIPVEPFDGLPVGMQLIGRHHADALLLDLALAVERACPWPLTAPASTR